MSELLRKSKISDLQMQNVWKYFIWTYFIVAAVYFLLLDASNLPDYAAYAAIFANPQNINEPLFVFLNNAFRNAGISYESFRNLILLFGLCSLLYVLLVVQKLESIPKSLKLNITSIILIAYILSIFIFEFYVIRIRAGLAISIFCIGIASVSRSPKYFFSWALFLITACAAFFVHKSSAVILFLTFGVTALPLLSTVKPESCNLWITNGLGLRLMYLLVTGTLLFLVLTQNQVRTGVVISTLNPIRFVCLSIIPLFIFMIDRIFFCLNEAHILATLSWAKTFEQFYTILSIALLIIYPLGMTEVSGEALVRFYTLLSFPALIGLFSAGSISAAPLCSYLLLVNASFFLATLNILPAFILDFMYWIGKS